MDRIKNGRLTLMLGLFLTAATLVAYWPVIHYDFVNCDDQAYVYENPSLQAGLSWPAAAWAFTTGYAGNWHPLTWLSHLLDVQFFGLNAGGHHLTSLLFHIGNTLLLFLALRRLTGAVWRSAFVAGLFALHPLHVESVAWVAERKDVLSGFFFLLTLWFYAKYVERKAESREQKAEIQNHASRITFHVSRFYLLSLAGFALGLMSKPMLVTLPFVLLLLDYWPLRRNAEVRMLNAETRVPPSTINRQLSTLSCLLVEKLPFFALSAASCVVTFLIQQRAGAVATASALPLGMRLENAAVACLLYLAKTVWPSGLAIFYPYQRSLPIELVGLSVAVLAALSLLAWFWRRRRPYLAVGWLWFLGMLVPVVGIVQVGQQSMADRYTYLPLIGIFIGFTWCWADAFGRNPKSEIRNPKQIQEPEMTANSKPAPPSSVSSLPTSDLGFVSGFGFRISGFVPFLLLVACLIVTRAQVRHWQNSETLFRHALAVTTENAFAHQSLGDELVKHGNFAEAESHFVEAVRLRPAYPEALSDLGVIRVMNGKVDEGVELYRAAIAAKPQDWKAHNNLARALCLQGKFDEAIREFRTALEQNPGATDTRGYLAAALVNQGKTNEASAVFEEALKLKPDDGAAHFKYASLLMALGQDEAAAAQFKAAIHYAPVNGEAHRRYGVLLSQSGRIPEAIEQFREAVRLEPGAEAHYNLATALLQQGQTEQAVAEYRESLRLAPDSPIVLNNLAWILAANPDERLRNGAEAVTRAERACQLTEYRQPMFIGTLAAAYAEAGRFEDAVKAAEKARDLASAAGQKELAERNGKLLELYRAGKPFHEARE